MRNYPYCSYHYQCEWTYTLLANRHNQEVYFFIDGRILGRKYLRENVTSSSVDQNQGIFLGENNCI